jgi:ornithine cyclodeaminase/alanine dehydrogenase-like protein (mu-crystallin family)
VDSVEAGLEEAQVLIIPLKKALIQRGDILAEVGEVVSGKKPGRGPAPEKSRGQEVEL